MIPYRYSLDLALLALASFPLWTRHNLHTDQPLAIITKVKEGGFRQIVLRCPALAAGAYGWQSKLLVFNVFDGRVLNHFEVAREPPQSPFLCPGHAAALPELYKSEVAKFDEVYQTPQGKTLKDVMAINVKKIKSINKLIIAMDNILDLLEPGSTRLSSAPFVHNPKTDVKASVQNLQSLKLRNSMLMQFEKFESIMESDIACVVCAGSYFIPGSGLVITSCLHPVCRTCQVEILDPLKPNPDKPTDVCPCCKQKFKRKTIALKEVNKFEWFFNPLEKCELCEIKEYDHKCKCADPTENNFARRVRDSKVTVLKRGSRGIQLNYYDEFAFYPFRMKRCCLFFFKGKSNRYKVFLSAMYELSPAPKNVKVVIEYEHYQSSKVTVPLYNSKLKNLSKTNLKKLRGTSIDVRKLDIVYGFVCEDVGGERNIEDEKSALEEDFQTLQESSKKLTEQRFMYKLRKKYTLRMLQIFWEEKHNKRS